MKHRTKHHKPIEKIPDAVFWGRVRQLRAEVQLQGRSAMFEALDLPASLPDGTSFTAAPRGIYIGNGCYRGGR